jgi:aminotransferase EvaB
MAEPTTNQDFDREIETTRPIEIPFVDLKRQYFSLKYEIKTAVSRVLKSGIYTNGPELQALEHAFANYCGVPYCYGVSNGRQAIRTALKALGIQPGDEVITVANAGMHATTAILEIGAMPHFVDINPDTLTMTPEILVNAITPGTRVAIITHLHGQIADLEGLCELADQFNIAVVEDCFQAQGAFINGKSVGSWGDIGCFGFSPNSNFGALGDAGAIITQDGMLAERIDEILDNGETHSSEQNAPGRHSLAMDEIQAAVLRAKLPLLDEMNLKRRLIAQSYMVNLDAADENLVYLNHKDQSVFHHFVLRTPFRELLKQNLNNNGIGWAVHYPQADHLDAACVEFGYLPGMLPETELACSEILSLPCYPELTIGEVEQVCKVVNETLADFMA